MPLRNRTHTSDPATLLGEHPTLDALPPPDTSRWVARRKAQVAAAVQTGLLSVDDACWRYRLTLEELASWQRGLRQFGVRGLQATRRISRRSDMSWTRRHA